MAFGKSSNGRNFGPNAKLFYFKLKTKDLPEPEFEVKQKDAEGKLVPVAGEKVRFVEGDLISIENKEFKHEKKTIKSVTATFRDKDDVYFVGIPHTYLGRNILNSLLALKTFGGVQIGVYQSKPKPDLKNPAVMRPGFASSAVRQNGDLVYGKFSKEELPAIPKVKVGDDLFSDDSAITRFFIEQVTEMSKVLKAAYPAGVNVGNGPAAAPANEPATADGPDTAAPGGDEDLPF